MSCKCEGLKDLIDKLETQFSDAEINNLQKEALEPVAKQIKEEMKSVAPVCAEHKVHGRDAVNFRYVKSRGYIVGLDNQMKDITGDYWENICG